MGGQFYAIPSKGWGESQKGVLMKNLFKMAGIIVLVAVIGFSMAGCATMFRTNSVDIVARSGATSQIKVFEGGRLVFEGPLPAHVPVSYGGSGYYWNIQGRTYTIEYTAEDGQTRTIAIEQRFNGWFIGSVLLAAWPIAIDFWTGSIYTYAKTTTLPISYADSSVIFFGENIPESDDLQVIGNINEPTEALNEEFPILFAMN